MALRFNLTGNGLLAIPGGYPIKLWTPGETVASGVLPKGILTVSADVYASKTATFHIALVTAPTTSGAADGAVVTDVDTEGDVTKTYQTDQDIDSVESTVSLTLPTDRAPAIYVVRFFADNITGETEDNEDHNLSITGTQNIKIPGAVFISKIYLT